MSVASPLASVDWPTVAAAIGTLIGAVWLSIKGAQKGKEKVESNKSELTAVVGASLIETHSIQVLSEQLRDNTQALREKASAIRENTIAIREQTAASNAVCAQVQRNTDLLLMRHRD